MTAELKNPYPTIGSGLNVADIDIVRNAAGPGNRLVIWFQGCLKRCQGCANPDFQELNIKSVLSLDRLAAFVKNAKGIDGITLTGGEPFLQAASIAPFSKLVRKLSLTVVCYTGYALEELVNRHENPELLGFLDTVDLLIDGEYRRELPCFAAYRSTSNQRLHFLSGRISPDECTKACEMIISVEHSSAVSTGTLPEFVWKKLISGLEKSGISLESR